MQELVKDFVEWGRERGLHGTTDLKPQLTKLIEELGEIAAGVARDDPERILDGAGDFLVVLVQFGEVFRSKYLGIVDLKEGEFLERCMEIAWAEIAKRTGRTVDGVFLKDEEPE
jgi:NTP pyrophosphatase (non-canonical NTP hydrolase)